MSLTVTLFDFLILYPKLCYSPILYRYLLLAANLSTARIFQSSLASTSCHFAKLAVRSLILNRAFLCELSPTRISRNRRYQVPRKSETKRYSKKKTFRYSKYSMMMYNPGKQCEQRKFLKNSFYIKL